MSAQAPFHLSLLTVFMALYRPDGPTPGANRHAFVHPGFRTDRAGRARIPPHSAVCVRASPVSATGPRKTLIAEHYQILNGVMSPPNPTLNDECPPENLMHTTLYPGGQPLSSCGQEKILESVEEELMAHPTRPRAND